MRLSFLATPRSVNGNSTFSSAGSHGNRLGSLNTTPTRSGSGTSIGEPLIKIVPDVCGRNPAIIISSDDFPQPLGPTSTTKRPGLTSIDTSDSATTSCPEVL